MEFAMRRKLPLLMILSVLLTICQSSENVDKPNPGPSPGIFPVGDVKKCLTEPGFQKVKIFEGLPGLGWDNLQNKYVGNLLKMNYSQCKTTDDGRYFIPDSVYTVPLKASSLDIFAELFQHWSNYTSTTSSSINVGGGLTYGHFGISGKFSHESENVKSHQVHDRSETTRVQARYVRYTAKIQPDSPLDDVFKKRLNSIAYNIEINKTDMARYESQLLVRDFGTHVITSVDAGAVVAKIDNIKSTFTRSYSFSKSSVLAAASASFGSIVSVSTEYKHSVSQEMMDQYMGNRTHSTVKTYGGPVFRPNNFTLDTWASELDGDLVPVDVFGDPIYFLITPYSLPTLPPSVLYELIQNVKIAVEEYYKFNTYRGCTHIDSPNFSFMANVDDGSCESQITNYTFGGVYQTCERRGDLSRNLCQGLDQKNPLTGQYSCNSDEYDAILLYQGSVSGTESRRHCRHCGFWGRRCCSNYNVYGSATYKAYWCVARGSVQQQSGFQFGGVYTSKIGNPLTQARSCPLYFYPLKIGTDISVCVSDDYELGYKYSVPFAGFFSCTTGNPLAIESERTHDYNLKDSELAHSLGSYLRSADPNHWPRGCPNGYSMHLVSVEKSCEINYCVKADSFSDKGLPPIRRPPFFDLPSDAYVSGSGTTEYLVSTNGQDWTEVEGEKTQATNESPTDTGTDTSGRDDLSRGAVAAIAVCVTLVCVVVFTFVFVKITRRQRTYSHVKLREETSDLMTDANRYHAYNDNRQTQVQVEN